MQIRRTRQTTNLAFVGIIYLASDFIRNPIDFIAGSVSKKCAADGGAVRLAGA